MTKNQRAAEAVSLLAAAYPDAACSLSYEKPHELLISVRLAAQCTDARVNLVTPALFRDFPTLEAIAASNDAEIGEYVKSCGLYKTKARDIVAMAKMLVDEYDGRLPDTMEDLLRLPGVGRKSANLILGDVYHQPAVVCDTHCIRITNLLGLTTTKDPLKCERELRACLPMEKANEFCHRLVLHGRAVCVARRPDCEHCVMCPVCRYGLQPSQKGLTEKSPPIMIGNEAVESPLNTNYTTKENIFMEHTEQILAAMKQAGEPLNNTKIAELTGLDKKDVEKAMKVLKATEQIVSPKRCYWEAK